MANKKAAGGIATDRLGMDHLVPSEHRSPEAPAKPYSGTVPSNILTTCEGCGQKIRLKNTQLLAFA